MKDTASMLFSIFLSIGMSIVLYRITLLIKSIKDIKTLFTCENCQKLNSVLVSKCKKCKKPMHNKDICTNLFLLTLLNRRNILNESGVASYDKLRQTIFMEIALSIVALSTMTYTITILLN